MFIRSVTVEREENIPHMVNLNINITMNLKLYEELDLNKLLRSSRVSDTYIIDLIKLYKLMQKNGIGPSTILKHIDVIKVADKLTEE